MLAGQRVADLERVGEGRVAEVFAWGDGLVLRLMRGSSPADAEAADREAVALRALAPTGVPAPALHDRTEVDGRPGTVVERCEGEDLMRLVERRPWRVRSVGCRLGRLHAAIHTVAAPPELPRVRAMIAARLQSRERLDALPDGDQLCHGDYHPANVLGEKVIDWDRASAGPPEADVARTCLLLVVASPPTGVPSHLRGIFRLGRRLMLGAYLRHYRRRAPLDVGAVERWIPVLAAARLTEGLDAERAQLLELARRDRVGLPGPQALDPEQRRFLIRGPILLTAAINLVLNAGPAWLSARGRDSIPLWSTPFVGGPSTITDTIGTLFFLPLITTVLVTYGVRRAVARGTLRPLSWIEDPVPLLQLLPSEPLVRGVLLAELCVVFLGPPMAGLLALTGFGDVSVEAFVVYKAALGVALGLLFTPAVALGAISDILPGSKPRGETG